MTLMEKIVAFFTGRKPPGTGRVNPNKPATQTSGTKSQERPFREKSQPRKMELLEVSSPRLYVGNLSYDAAESDLIELFNGVGGVQSAEVVSNRHTQRSKGFAFVQMQSIDEAKRAVAELHDKDFMGRKLVVSGARPAGSGSED